MAGEQSEADLAASDRAEIRRLEPDEWATLRQVRLTSLADAPDAFSSTLDREQDFDEQLWRSRIASSAIFVAWLDGRPAGMAAGVPEQTARAAGFGDAAPGVSHLVSMWVSPQARGKGIADGLVESVCQWARTDGATTVELWVTDVNARARAFYRRMGFVSTGKRQPVRPDEPDRWEEQLTRPA
jgi:GNAT superfamily N-acetyltransferase